MRVSAIFFAGLATVALAVPVEVGSGLVERYRPIKLTDSALEGKESQTEKRQYEPIEKQIKEVAA
ncbi:uncharacterized protein GGS22DRAFT_150089 [Annulohypoxylon maeteangense]|uniref:uncharacterized protein n=1 Tax=Annulohypoxylon maeteangense TaxID=1927788 RepID=UPI002008A029|nr:uncharacterized protein GGS22DRAFT_150089 [Annulohypoxylon maeteangense]KAI0890139.1 hypothetical protein GGS22DRAFT_150089 [Annulohypoxylon maeteangense]